MNALIGESGYVGTTLQKQAIFESKYRSNNIGLIDSLDFETVVCAAAPAQKWIANREPIKDRENIEGLITHLKTITCKTFILISTVDVFQSAVGVDEKTSLNLEGLHPYGSNRQLLENFVKSHFSNYLIIRLAGLVGPGLRKNIIFDFLNNNNLHTIDSRGVFQFYPMVNLWYDIQIALKANLKLVHFTAEPISVAEIAEAGFGINFHQSLSNPPAIYDFQTNYASLFGGNGHYQYNKRDTIQAVRAYFQSEPVTLK
jgi:dTDP-4-dehydrorhamnose reductase